MGAGVSHSGRATVTASVASQRRAGQPAHRGAACCQARPTPVSLPAMAKVEKSALVPHTAQEMYALVAEVERYPEFLPWCRSARQRSNGDGSVTATIEMAKGPLHKSFTTRNHLREGERIEIRLVDGPFKRLDGTWRFEPRGQQGCRVTLDLEFDFSSRLLRAVVGPVFHEIANTMVDAFCRRAANVYRASTRA